MGKYPRSRRTFVAAWVLLVLGPLVQGEEILRLTNGRQIAVERYWEEDDQVFYEKNGSIFGFPSRLLERVEAGKANPAEASHDDASPGLRNEIANETLREARERAREGHAVAAADRYREAIRQAPEIVGIRMELAELYVELGDLAAAEYELERATRLAHGDALVRERLGDVYYARGRTAPAIREWQAAHLDNPGPALLFKLKRALRENNEDIDFEARDPARFVIRYEGRVDEAMGRTVAVALEDAFAELAREFGASPARQFTVTLYTNREFRDVTHAPTWVSALNDGEIRIPIEGVTTMTPKVRRLLRHELAHSFINALTAGNCPSWFHEGLAQLHEGSEGLDPYPRLTAAQSDGKLLPLWTLEGSLTHYSKEEALLVYSEALAATEYVAVRRGREAHTQLLRLLAQGRKMDDALKQVIGLDYHEFQAAWEADLHRYQAGGRR